MTPQFIAFTDRGLALARRLADALGGTVTRGGREVSASAWAALHFPTADALVFVGAAGIAVRAVAPLVSSKYTDPAVVAVDERGRYAVPLLSGHLGGANDLARDIAALCGAEAVITTATDRAGVFSADEWARHHNCVVLPREAVKALSARLLAGETLRFSSDYPLPDPLPPGLVPSDPAHADLRLTLRPTPGRPALVPRLLTLGVGCRRGVGAGEIEDFFLALLAENGLPPEAVAQVSSLDRKAHEPGLVSFCHSRGLPLLTFSPAQLMSVPGPFSSSPFVQSVTGTDNVCERSAVLASGGGTLLCPKASSRGITLALAVAPWGR